MNLSTIKKTKLDKICSLPCCHNDAVAVITNEKDVFSQKVFICNEHINEIVKFSKTLKGKGEEN